MDSENGAVVIRTVDVLRYEDIHVWAIGNRHLFGRPATSSSTLIQTIFPISFANSSMR